MTSYRRGLESGQVNSKKTKKTGTPKENLGHAPNALVNFCWQRRDRKTMENLGKSFGEVTRLLSEEWKGMTKDEKDGFKNAAEAAGDKCTFCENRFASKDLLLWHIKKVHLNIQSDGTGVPSTSGGTSGEGRTPAQRTTKAACHQKV